MSSHRKIQIATFCIAALLLMPACPGFWRGVRGVIACAPELIAAVGEALKGPQWERDLSAMSKKAGIDAITCAVWVIAEGAAEGLTESRSLLAPQDSARARARLWLQRQKKGS